MSFLCFHLPSRFQNYQRLYIHTGQGSVFIMSKELKDFLYSHGTATSRCSPYNALKVRRRTLQWDNLKNCFICSLIKRDEVCQPQSCSKQSSYTAS